MTRPCCCGISIATSLLTFAVIVASTAATGSSAETGGAAAPDRVASASVVAIVTHRGGFAAGLGHDHLISAPLDAVRSTFVADDPTASRFALSFDTEQLVVDDTALRERWSPRLLELGLLTDPMKPLKEKDRNKIRKSMLGKTQLDARTHPTIEVSVAVIRKAAGTVGGVDFDYVLEVDFAIHGTRVRTPVAARLDERDGCRSIEAVGPLTFSELGIRPYSAALGAVKNRDEFHVYLNLQLEC